VSGALRGYVLVPGFALAHFFDGSLTAMCGQESKRTPEQLRDDLRDTSERVVRHLELGTPDVVACRTCVTMRLRVLYARSAALLKARAS